MNKVFLVFLLLITYSYASEASTIQNAKIQRVGADIELSWEYDPAISVDQADIWVLSGRGTEFDKNPRRYNKTNSVKDISLFYSKKHFLEPRRLAAGSLLPNGA